jgi:competence protein ComEC
VPAAGAVIGGILAGDLLGGGMLVWTVVAILASAAWATGYFRRARSGLLLVPLLVLIAAASAAWYHATVDAPPNDVGRIAEVARGVVTIEGVVVRSPQQSSPPVDVFLPTVPYYIHTTLTIDCERARVAGKWVPASGRVRAVVRQAMPPRDAEPKEIEGEVPPPRAPDLGDRVRMTGLLSPPGKPVNPGGFDFSDYLHRQGVRALFRTDHWELVKVIEPGADRLRWIAGAVQRWAVQRLDCLPSDEGRGVAAAMLFGRRELLDFDSGNVRREDIEHAFLATGTVHYMAVSGFNVALVAAPIIALARLLSLGRRLTAVIVAASVLAFVLMTELEPPVLRAAILVWVICLGWFLGREALSLNTLGAGVILVLLARPGDLFSMSFQLSFLAVLGMIYVVDRAEDLLVGRFVDLEWLRSEPAGEKFLYRRLVRATLLVSVAATLVNIPLIAGKFHIVSWLSPIASTVLLPLVFLLTVSGMLLVAFGWIAPWLGNLLAAGPDGLGRTIAAVVRAMANVPGAYFWIEDISPTWLVLAYVLIVAWVWRKRLGIPRRRLAMAVLAAATVFVWTSGHRPPQNVRATFLAVGNGNCDLLELPNGRVILYDAGSSLSHVRAAETAIAPALWSRGINRVDAVFFSHPHFDHFKDILPLVERFGVRQVFVPPTFMRQRLKSDNMVIEALLERGVRVEFFGAGDRLAGTGDVDIRAVWPRGPKSQTRAINDGSLALVVTAAGRRILLAGDLEPAGQAALLEAEPHLRADAMLWPHHGHEPAAIGRFAGAIGARMLIIPASRPFMPHPKPPWAAGRGIAILHTGEVGAVTLELRPEGVRAETFAGGPAPAEDEAEIAGDSESLEE